MRILLFNPSTEYALATGASFYTPPAVVEEFRVANQLLPEAWADHDDMILVDDPSVLRSSSVLVGWSDLERIYMQYPDARIEPWGWNHALRRRLLDNGVPESSLPTLEYLDMLRSLAHRRTTILLNEEWNDRSFAQGPVPLPVELFSEDDCVTFYRNNSGCWMKAPWSSSGRGVINTAADMEERHVRPWCRGIIRRQGSVMAETAADRVADYATEWRLSDGKADYLGLSSFLTSNRGKYISNSRVSQSQMKMQFDNQSAIRLYDVIDAQKEILEKVLRGYEGLLGIDMIVERSGALRPFVETNLRRTMGMLYL